MRTVTLKIRTRIDFPIHSGTQPSPEIRANPSDPSSRCRGLFQVIAKMRSVSVHSVTRCKLFASLALFSSSLFSSHGPFIVPRAKLVYRCNGFHSVLLQSQPTQPIPTIVCFCFLCCTSDAGSIQHMFHIFWWSVGSMVNTIPILQVCSDVVLLKAGSGFVPASAQFFGVRTFD